ncbi:5-formyltetrahydrofolate cyclo-ligase [Luteirhabdus pelagi]|uniref:5-formyltetrahydrofolate cyclo-ligase n=1 Tax=Luteirhabdus pelagi TaxID=2792783 RepID=UPI0019399C42|nr:5-formyltetrahydrofolate cyclo-ligase [Luteirhabdus pelagi]
MDKRTLRKEYRMRRASLSDDEVEELSLKIANQALTLPLWEKEYYHIFLPISNKKEVNTEYLLQILHGKDKSIVVPKARFEDREMDHILLQDNTKIAITDMGIPEPVSGIEVPAEQLDVIFVPLLAYDEQGNRIGYGKGFYDRFLSKCKRDARFIGLSFFPPEKNIFFESTDVPLHSCITPEKVFHF